LGERRNNMKIITPAMAKSTSAIATSTIMSKVLLFPPLFEESELVPVVVSEVVVVAAGVAVETRVAVGEDEGEGEGVAVELGIVTAAVMVRCFTPLV
jgi:hypothetical protein